MADDRLIAALDVHTRAEAENLVQRLGETVNYYKVGMELFYALGGDMVTWLKGAGKKVFLDLKLHDIPNTAANGLCSLLCLRPDILNVHTAGGLRMMAAAADALHRAAEETGIPCPKLIGVTVLTSMDAEDWRGLGHTGTIADAVLRRAKLAQEAGLDGVVASPAETAEIRRTCGDDFLIVVACRPPFHQGWPARDSCCSDSLRHCSGHHANDWRSSPRKTRHQMRTM